MSKKSKQNTHPKMELFGHDGNIFAILGLRAMFFLLAGVADKFWLLKPGVSFLLLFIGIKLLIHDFIEIDAVWSLVFIVLVLVVSIVGSLVVKKKTA